MQVRPLIRILTQKKMKKRRKNKAKEEKGRKQTTNKYWQGKWNIFLRYSFIVWNKKLCKIIQTMSGIFRWGTHLYMSLFLSARPSVRPSVTQHHISGTLHHMIMIFGIYTYVKWWYLHFFIFNFFFIFWKIWFFRLLGGVKGQKMAQNEK